MTIHATGDNNVSSTGLNTRGGAVNQTRKKPKNPILLDFSAPTNTQYYGHREASVWTESVPNATRS